MEQNHSDEEIFKQTLYLLEQTFSNPNNKERSEAEKKLRQLEVNIMRHIHYIIKAIFIIFNM